MMNIKALEEVHESAHRGELIFPDVVRRCLAAGVERYTVDFMLMESVYYSHEGETHRFVSTWKDRPAIAETFSVEQVQTCIRAAQRDEIRFPEFVKRVTAAGSVGYTAYLAGKRVTYVGRLGDSHTEHFPKP